MTVKRFIFIMIIMAIAMGSYLFMNKDYDPLARYQYQLSSDQHALIVDNLSLKEIEYLIEYAIAPEQYIDYVGLPGFNLYLIDQYNKMHEMYGWAESKEEIMRLVNCTVNLYDDESLKEVIDSYYIYEIIQYHEAGYTELLAPGVNQIDFMIPSAKSIGFYTPKDLVAIDPDLTVDNEEIMIRLEANEALNALYGQLKQDDRSYRDLKVASGFISAQALQEIYNSDQNDRYMFGHSEYQLGLVVSFIIQDDEMSNFTEHSLGMWLKENAYRFGFIQTDQDNHYRYVSVAVATALSGQENVSVENNNE